MPTHSGQIHPTARSGWCGGSGAVGSMSWPPVIVAGLAVFVMVDVSIIAGGGSEQIVPSALALVYQPVLTLLVLASTVP